jgi:hypothetical protein
MKMNLFFISILFFAFTSCGNKPNKTEAKNESGQSETVSRPDLTFKKSFVADEGGWASQMIVHADASNGKQYEFSIELPTPKDTTFVGESITEDDMNFDGYADIQVQLGYFGAGGGNLIYDAFVWNNQTQTFDRVENYTNLCNPSIDAANKCIVSHGNPIGYSIEYEKYEWQEGKLVITKQWIEEMQSE